MGDESGSLGNSLNLNLVWKYYRSIQLVRYLGCCLLLTLFILFHSSCSACNDARIVFLLLTSDSLPYKMLSTCRCGNVAAILELDENLNMQFRVFEAAPHESRGVPSKRPAPDYFLWCCTLNARACCLIYAFKHWHWQASFADDVPCCKKCSGLTRVLPEGAFRMSKSSVSRSPFRSLICKRVDAGIQFFTE